MTYAIGSLVQARGREWVVLPESTDDFLVLRPLGGTDHEIAGIYLPLEGEDVRPASFDLPDPDQPGDFISSRLLRDAVRLGFRNGAGPFRSLARLNVEPRPYQLVPLLMGLKLDPVRLLIADDVGIGKTIEAGLIARELLDRGEIQRLAVLCPPHLAEQWQAELRDKFNIDAKLVLPSTVARLERNLGAGQSLFDVYPFVIVSIEYIKSGRRRHEFVRTCPEFVIVDEAHTVAYAPGQRGGRHLRHQLVQELAKDGNRHLLLVTATPHSGNEGAFRSLLALLRPDFADLPEDLSGRINERYRREIAKHLVQRRRADIRHYLQVDTMFPRREDAEESYTLTPEYARLFERVLRYARERVSDASGARREQRVRWWSALALLRSLASSPAAAAATLRTRSGVAETATVEEADEVGERLVLDLDNIDTAEVMDLAPGALENEDQPQTQRDRLLRMAREAKKLRGPKYDAKLKKAIAMVKKLLAEGYQPILFCRFIPTAEYVAEELKKALPRGVEVAAVTGMLPPAEREQRVAELGQHPQRVLVATDCLSEGINLQDYFNAVMHYDLSWNPTRHEQREGRVDRYGQPSPVVRAITYYGKDNQIDGIVLDVLLRKHKAIRSSLGISVPVPANTSDVVQALMQGLLLREGQIGSSQMAFDFVQEHAAIQKVLDAWVDVSEREKRSRTMFAQQSIKVDEVGRMWREAREAIGSGVDVQRFVRDAVRLHGGVASERNDHIIEVQMPNLAPLREAVGDRNAFRARFELPVPEGVLYLNRTHPIVEGLAGFVLDSALDPALPGKARRSGVIRTDAVTRRTTLLLLRLRHQIVTHRGRARFPLLAEESVILAYEGSPRTGIRWLEEDEARVLMQAQPTGNVARPQATRFLQQAVEAYEAIRPHLDAVAHARAQALLEAHTSVRTAARQSGKTTVEPQLPPDILGIYILLPI